MSYRFYAERVAPIGSKAGSAGVDTIMALEGCDGLRLTVPHLSISVGETAQTLTILQVEDQDLISAFDGPGKTVTLETLDSDLTGRQVALEKTDGSFFFTSVASSDEKVHTLVGTPPATTKVQGRFYLFCALGGELAQSVALEASTNHELTAPAPGRFMARDFCYPLILHLTNTTNPATIRGGSVVYIAR